MTTDTQSSGVSASGAGSEAGGAGGRTITPSPSILINLPGVAEVNSHQQLHQLPINATPNRARSLSPSAVSTTSVPSSPSGTTSHHATAAASSSLSAISPRPSMHFATTRPSPVVPASPSLSRPGSPKFGKSAAKHDDLPTSPARSPKDEHVPLSRTNSAVDLTHIFERGSLFLFASEGDGMTDASTPDVEFNATHTISPQEAVDVAIPPVLDEAAAVITASQDLTSAELDEATAAPIGSGWSSPVIQSQVLQNVASSSSGAARSPKSRQARSFSPDSVISGGRAASPGSTASFSVATPSSSPPNAYPFTQHLSDALEIEAIKSSSSLASADGKSNMNSGGGVMGEPLNASNASMSGGSGIAAPAPLMPLFSSGFMTAGSPAPASPSIETSLNERRRLSFVSYADVINEERMAELTGSPLATQTPSAAVSPSGTRTAPATTSAAASPTPLDLAPLRAALSSAGTSPS